MNVGVLKIDRQLDGRSRLNKCAVDYDYDDDDDEQEKMKMVMIRSSVVAAADKHRQTPRDDTKRHLEKSKGRICVLMVNHPSDLNSRTNRTVW